MRLGGVYKNPDIEFIYRYVKNGTHSRIPHDHTYYEFFLTLGSSIHYINDEEYVLHEGMLVFIRPKDKHFFGPKGRVEPRHVNISFRPEVIDSLFEYLGPLSEELRKRLLDADMPPVCMLTEREKIKVLTRMNRFNVQMTEETPEQKLDLRFFVSEMLSLFADKTVSEKENLLEQEIPFWLESVCEKMSAHENFSEGLSRMVELSGKTREHLARSMKKYKNITLSAFVNNLRLEYVANMLVTSDMSIVDLCYDSGFSSLDYFGKQFKRKYGMAPSEFRNAIHGEWQKRGIPF